MEKNTLESALKEFSQTSGTNANDVKEFFALMSDGSIKRMPKEDMATVVGGLLKSRKLYPYMDRGKVVDFNSSTTPGMYFIEDLKKELPGNPGITYGTLEVSAVTSAGSTIITQVAYEQYEDRSAFRRTFSNTGAGVDWISY